jgi:hypothetical protein
MSATGGDHSVDASSRSELIYPNSDGELLSSRWRTRYRRAFLGSSSLPKLAWLVPFALAAVYGLVFLLQLQHNIREIAWSSDYSSAFTIAETVARSGTGGHTVLSGSGQWVSLWFGLLTARLPFHHELWGLAPTLSFICAASLLGWSLAQLTTRRTAILGVLLVVVASPLALAFFMAPFAHNSVYPCTALVGAYLIWLARGDARRKSTSFAAPVLIGIGLGVCWASDLLLIATAVAPLALTAIMACLRRSRRSRLLALSAFTTLVVGAGVAKLTSEIMASSGFAQLPTPTESTPLSEFPARAELLFKGLKSLFNGYLGPGSPGTFHTELGIACVVLMSAALLASLILGAFTGVKFIASSWRSDRPENRDQLASSVHVIYWVSSAVAACSAFIIGAEASAANVHASYYGTVIFSVAAVVPLLMRHGSLTRWLVPAGASIFFAASIAGMLSHYLDVGAGFALPRYVGDITQFAQANDVTNGYGGYWEAASTTWNSDERVIIRPVMLCEHPEAADLCPFTFARVPAWYAPDPKQHHTFLLVDKWEQWVGGLPPGLGPPLASRSFGTMTMYIYPYDIASRMGPAPD